MITFLIEQRSRNLLRCYSLHKTMYRPTESVDWCQCCQQRVSLADGSGSSDFFGNDDSSQIVHSSDNASCFHISFSFYDTFDGRQVAAPTFEMLVRFVGAATSRPPYNNFTNYAVSICKQSGIILRVFIYFRYI